MAVIHGGKVYCQGGGGGGGLSRGEIESDLFFLSSMRRDE